MLLKPSPEQGGKPPPDTPPEACSVSERSRHNPTSTTDCIPRHSGVFVCTEGSLGVLLKGEWAVKDKAPETKLLLLLSRDPNRSWGNGNCNGEESYSDLEGSVIIRLVWFLRPAYLPTFSPTRLYVLWPFYPHYSTCFDLPTYTRVHASPFTFRPVPLCMQKTPLISFCRNTVINDIQRCARAHRFSHTNCLSHGRPWAFAAINYISVIL